MAEEVGYFDKYAVTKPLMHLWSLAVEEQFYIFWPILLYSSWKKSYNLVYVILGLMLISFAININLTLTNTTNAFYLPMGRAWELLAGCILALTHSDKKYTIYAYSI